MNKNSLESICGLIEKSIFLYIRFETLIKNKMSRTFKHIETAKFKQGLINYNKTSNGFNNFCKRCNWNIGRTKLEKRLKMERDHLKINKL